MEVGLAQVAGADARLMAAAQAGDRDAFARVYERYRPALLRRCLWALGSDRDAAEDLVQESFLRAWRHLGSYRLDRPVWPWLLRIAQRLWIDHWRAGGRRPEAPALLLDDPAEPRSQGFESVEESVTSENLARALSALTPRYRRLLLLQVLEDWTYADLARLDGSSITAIGKALSRARARVRVLLEDEPAACG